MGIDQQQFDLIKEEYIQLKEEQRQRIGFRDNMIFVQLATIGAITSWSIANLDKPGAVGAFLIIPWLCSILGWTYLVNDHAVSGTGKYIRDYLTPRLVGNSTFNFIEADQKKYSIPAIFGWEIFHRIDSRRRSRKLVQCVIDELTFVAPGVLALGAYWWLEPTSGATSRTVLYVMIVELILMALLSINIIRYSDFGYSKSVNYDAKSTSFTEGKLGDQIDGDGVDARGARGE